MSVSELDGNVLLRFIHFVLDVCENAGYFGKVNVCSSCEDTIPGNPDNVFLLFCDKG